MKWIVAPLYEPRLSLQTRRGLACDPLKSQSPPRLILSHGARLVISLPS